MKDGDFVKIDYIGRLENGEIFDLTSEDVAKNEKIYNPKIRYGPISIIVGAKLIIPGFDKALKDMNTGEKKIAEIKPEDGFGPRDQKLVRVLPIRIFEKQKIEPRPGLVIDFSGVKGRIQSVMGGRVRVDFNNPLAGKTLKYEIEIKEKIDEPKQQVKSIFDFFNIKNTEIKIENDVIIAESIKLPVEIKEKISSLIMNYVVLDEKEKHPDKVQFIETFERQSQS